MKERREIPTEVYSRIVGYFRPIHQWNKGKQEEFTERKDFPFPLDLNISKSEILNRV